MRISIIAIIGIIVTQGTVFFVEEAFTIASVAIFQFAIAILLTTAFFSFFALSTSWLCLQTGLSCGVDKWIESKKQKMSSTIEKAFQTGFFFICLQTAILISPSTSAIVLFAIGKKKPEVYYLDILFSFVSAVVWCLVYGGGILAIKKWLLRM